MNAYQFKSQNFCFKVHAMDFDSAQSKAQRLIMYSIMDNMAKSAGSDDFDSLPKEKRSGFLKNLDDEIKTLEFIGELK